MELAKGENAENVSICRKEPTPTNMRKKLNLNHFFPIASISYKNKFQFMGELERRKNVKFLPAS